MNELSGWNGKKPERLSDLLLAPALEDPIESPHSLGRIGPEVSRPDLLHPGMTGFISHTQSDFGFIDIEGDADHFGSAREGGRVAILRGILKNLTGQVGLQEAEAGVVKEGHGDANSRRCL